MNNRNSQDNMKMQQEIIKEIKDLKDKIKTLEIKIIEKSEEYQTCIIEQLELELKFDKQNQMSCDNNTKEYKFRDASNIFTCLDDD